MHGSPRAGELESAADFAVQARQRPVLKRYTGMAAPPHPYPWATWAPRRRRHHRVGLESGLNQDNRSTQYLRRVVLAAILALGAAIRCWRLDAGGFIVPYYFAGVRSMMGSWHNFFYNAFDPAGFVSLDKPPVAFWLQTASAKLLGFGTVSVGRNGSRDVRLKELTLVVEHGERRRAALSYMSLSSTSKRSSL
jgi:hypothetical protein